MVEEEGEEGEKGGKIEVARIEEEAIKTKENIDKLVCIMSKYQSDISDMDFEIKEAHDMMSKLFSIKREFLKMQAKCW